jgi:hypothetical protein
MLEITIWWSFYKITISWLIAYNKTLIQVRLKLGFNYMYHFVSANR